MSEQFTRILVAGRELRIDLAAGTDLAIRLDLHGAQPRHFAAPAAGARPLRVDGFTGAVADGASCNCEVVTFIPHCNGTHTECAGHLTAAPLDALAIVPRGLVPALLLSVTPEPAAAAGEDSDPAPEAPDLLLTRRSLERAWPREAPFAPRALVVRTLPNLPGKRHRDYSGQTPPYLSRPAAQLLVERGIEHLVIDLPSIDREHDAGRLTAHRLFFGLPPGSTALRQAARSHATVTELAYIPDALADGPYLLELQVPALSGDAVPSRPILYGLLGSGA
ncbi:MAG: cyclase family protein [Proteobacteria bacterium]|nr:cyclase family protein [Pseudomonadota bacterium]